MPKYHELESFDADKAAYFFGKMAFQGRLTVFFCNVQYVSMGCTPAAVKSQVRGDR